MKRQRNIAQIKEQGRKSQDQMKEEETGKPSEKEFRAMKVKMIQNFKNRMEKSKNQLTHLKGT